MLFEVDAKPLSEALKGAEPNILDGRRVSSALLAQVHDGVEILRGRGITPTLAVVQVGEDPASSVYVRHKIRACRQVNIESRHRQLPVDVSAAELYAVLRELNENDDVHGILLQLPLPDHLASMDAIVRIDPRKDVDGFHIANLGCLTSGRSELEPCTPRGVMTLLAAAGVSLRGKRAVVIGRSVIVGRPMAQMLVRSDATVTVCHRYTAELAEEVARADVLVVATGVPHLVRGEWIKPGAVVIDVGISREDGGRLVGDVDFKVARERASWITPVPGGVGPMTVATLLESTVRATCMQHGLVIRDGRALVAPESDVSFEEVDLRLSLTARNPMK